MDGKSPAHSRCSSNGGCHSLTPATASCWASAVYQVGTGTGKTPRARGADILTEEPDTGEITRLEGGRPRSG